MKLSDGSYRFLRKSCNFSGHAHELTFSCFHGLPLFKNDRTCQWLADSINQARKKHEYDLWAYVIMPTHVHLLVHPRKEHCKISAILKSIKLPVAKRAIRYLRDHDPKWLNKLTTHHNNGSVDYRFWQRGGGYDRNIIEPTTLLKSIEYIEANPVRKELIDSSASWKWSSAAWHAGSRDVPLSIDSIPMEFIPH